MKYPLENSWLKKTLVIKIILLQENMCFKCKLDNFVFGNGRITVLSILSRKVEGKEDCRVPLNSLRFFYVSTDGFMRK